MKKNNKSILILVTLIIILLVFLVNVDLIINNIINYTNIFFYKLFPSSFILYLIIYMIIEYGFIQFINNYLHINSCSYILFILSLINGFPSGAKYSKLLYDKNLISKDYLNTLIKFSHFPNILFVLGTIKNIINDKVITFYLLISLIISNFIIMCFSKKENINYNYSFNNKSFSIVLKEGIIYSFKTIILIYGTSLFFYLISSVISIQNLYLKVFIDGMFDLTNGIVGCSLINNVFIRSLFILLFLSFGSFSIHMQVFEIIEDKDSYLSFVKGRFIGSFISIICFIILFII